MLHCLIEELDRRAVSIDANSLGVSIALLTQFVTLLKTLVEKTLDGRTVLGFVDLDSFLYDRQNLWNLHVESTIREELAGNVADQLIIRWWIFVGSNL